MTVLILIGLSSTAIVFLLLERRSRDAIARRTALRHESRRLTVAERRLPARAPHGSGGVRPG